MRHKRRLISAGRVVRRESGRWSLRILYILLNIVVSSVRLPFFNDDCCLNYLYLFANFLL